MMYLRLVRFNLSAEGRSKAQAMADDLIPAIKQQPGCQSARAIAPIPGCQAAMNTSGRLQGFGGLLGCLVTSFCDIGVRLPRVSRTT